MTALLLPVFQAGDTYTIDTDLTEEAYLAYWTSPGHDVFVAVDETGRIHGTYYMRRNQAGGGSHVCNCGYITDPASRGRGVARTMLAHSLDHARASGYRAMQYNFVVETNARAITTWEKAGFDVVGRLPAAFDHPSLGFVDALVMMKHFAEED